MAADSALLLNTLLLAVTAICWLRLERPLPRYKVNGIKAVSFCALYLQALPLPILVGDGLLRWVGLNQEIATRAAVVAGSLSVVCMALVACAGANHHRSHS